MLVMYSESEGRHPSGRLLFWFNRKLPAGGATVDKAALSAVPSGATCR